MKHQLLSPSLCSPDEFKERLANVPRKESFWCPGTTLVE